MTIRIRTELTGEIATVRALIKHPMETGNRKDPAGKALLPHYIREVICEHNSQPVLTARWGPGISKNPYLSFQFGGAKPGDRLTLRWEDNRGGSDSMTVTIE